MGGMASASTAAFFTRLVECAQERGLHERLRILVDCDPNVPNRTAAIKGLGPSSGPALAAMAQGLLAAGADILVMPCNAAHAFCDAIEEAAPGRLISIVDLGVAAAVEATNGRGAVGVLATEGTRVARLFETALAAAGQAALAPDDEDLARLIAVIERIKHGRAGEADRAELVALGTALADRGAGCVIAGCTELPQFLKAGDLPVPLIDSVELLARRALDAAQSEDAIHRPDASMIGAAVER